MNTALPPVLLFPWGRAHSGAVPQSLLRAEALPILVADISNYTGEITDAEVASLQAAGVGHVVVRISLEDGARQAITAEQLSALRARGVPVSGYIFPDYNRIPADYLSELFDLAGDLHSLWLDLEPPGMPSFAAFRDWANDARAASRVPVGIYTAAWCIAQIPDWEGLPDFPLWDANYAPFTDLSVNFGGWTRAAGVQYEGSVQVGGVLCDLSKFNPAALS